MARSVHPHIVRSGEPTFAAPTLRLQEVAALEAGAERLGVIPAHVSWLHDTGERQSTACGCEIEIWALTPEEDEEVLSAWARHFRQHYISDEDLPAMVDGTGLSTAEYLRATLFPDASKTPGPSLRSGDFGEILVADYIEYLLGYWSPRILRYQDRWNRNDSTGQSVNRRISAMRNRLGSKFCGRCLTSRVQHREWGCAKVRNVTWRIRRSAVSERF